MLPEGQPHPQHHLGGAKDPHALWLLDEPHPDSTGALGTDNPQPRMLVRSQELYEPIPDRDYRENLYESPLPHRALLLLVSWFWSFTMRPIWARQTDSSLVPWLRQDRRKAPVVAP
jgi:hypothetical protein